MKTSHEDQPAPPQPRSAQEQDTGQAQAGAGYGEPAGAASAGGSLLRALRPWTALYAAGATTLILGLIVLIWPRATLLVLALLFGCYLVISGVLSVVEGISRKDAGSSGMRVAYIVLGVLGVLLGLFCLRRIDVTVLVLAFMVAAFWIMRGSLDLAAAMSGGEQYAGLRALTGVLSLVAGILVLFWPGITLTALLVVAGIWLIMYGISLLFLGRQLHKVADQG
jgi:uncharacterized membrane protein HdeD (DUF308 family)